ncbi:MAG TPA: hypothetical protein VLE22_12120 [Bryobacteraceae bacterium]|nr:hypothetical protein [Bryobacteraceae bacterium]
MERYWAPASSGLVQCAAQAVPETIYLKALGLLEFRSIDPETIGSLRVRVFSKGAAVLAGLLALEASTSLNQEFEPPSYAEDPRVSTLSRFFEEKDSPVAYLARDFILVADWNGLDWRLLPAIAFVESGGGKAFRNNNIFGWDNGNWPFPSIRASIHFVGERLSASQLYEHKNVAEKLATYNPHSHYPLLVTSVMDEIGPSQFPPTN